MSENFVSYIKNNNEQFLKVIEKAASHTPPKMNRPDYRFQISGLFCHAISKEFSLGGEGNIFQCSYNPGYDILFSEKDKISVKIMKEVFQNNFKNGKITKGRPIILKNFNGKTNSNDYKIDYDYLLTIQRGDPTEDGVSKIGFGVINSSNVTPLITKSKKEDQLLAVIPNSSYDYFSGLIEITHLADVDKNTTLDREFSIGLAKTYDRVLSVKD